MNLPRPHPLPLAQFAAPRHVDVAEDGCNLEKLVVVIQQRLDVVRQILSVPEAQQHNSKQMCAHVHVCACVWVRACLHMCVRACVCVCVCVFGFLF